MVAELDEATGGEFIGEVVADPSTPMRRTYGLLSWAGEQDWPSGAWGRSSAGRLEGERPFAHSPLVLGARLMVRVRCPPRDRG